MGITRNDLEDLINTVVGAIRGIIVDPTDPLAKANVTNERPLDDKYGLVVRPILPRTGFGEIRTEHATPIVQMTAVYGITDRILSTTQLGGSVSASQSMFICTTGTNANGVASLLSKRQVKYRSGQGILARFTALFDTPQADSFQEAGLASNTDRLGFGYNGTDFGIVYSHGGETQIQELTVATGASGGENATIGVDGTDYTVALTAGATDHNAREIAADLNSQAPTWTFTANGSQVVARSFFAQTDIGAFTFTSSTAVASWAQVQSGLNPTDSFINQVDWNIRTRPELDPSKGNVYQVQFQFLGYGAMFFSVENPVTGEYEIVHTLEFSNANVLTNMANPIFRVGWTAFNRGNTTSLTMKGSSASVFNEGEVVPTERTRSVDGLVASAGLALLNIFTIRNRSVFGTKTNRIETILKRIAALTDSTKGGIIEVIAGATFAGDLDYSYVDKVNSTTEIAKDLVAITGGRVLASFPVTTAGTSFATDELEEVLLPGEFLTIAGRVVQTPASLISATMVFKEDI